MDKTTKDRCITDTQLCPYCGEEALITYIGNPRWSTYNSGQPKYRVEATAECDSCRYQWIDYFQICNMEPVTRQVI